MHPSEILPTEAPPGQLPHFPGDAWDAVVSLIRQQAPVHAGEDWRDEPAVEHWKALDRHLDAIGEADDPGALDESGFPHAVHVAARALMACEAIRA